MTEPSQINIGDWVKVLSGPETIAYQWGMVGTVDAISEKDNGVVIKVHGQPLQLIPLHCVTPYDISQATAIRK